MIRGQADVTYLVVQRDEGHQVGAVVDLAGLQNIFSSYESRCFRRENFLQVNESETMAPRCECFLKRKAARITSRLI